MTRHGAGVFRRLLHVIDDDPRTIDFDGIRLWFAECGAVCVVLGESDPAGRTSCGTCFPAGDTAPERSRPGGPDE